MHILVVLALIAASAEGKGTTVRKTGTGPTGYEVDFVFTPNSTTNASSVLLGGFPFFSDPLHASLVKTDGYTPYEWRADMFSMRLSPDYGNEAGTLSGLAMQYNNQTGDWEVTVPLPSGTWLYAYYPDCTTGNWRDCNVSLVDPSNLPLEAFPGDQLLSAIQLPFDGEFQVQNYDWQLPLEDVSKRGNVSFHQYASPGSTSPYPDVHDVGIYLPSEYGLYSNKTYPVLYLSNGGQGSDSDWFQQAQIHHIMDRLIDAGALEPTILVTPDWYNLGFTLEEYETNATLQAEYLDVVGYDRFFNKVRENFFSYLMPWVEDHYAIANDSSQRAFGGLALGGTLTLAMLFNATDYFSSYCVMSPTPAPAAGDSQYNATTNPALRQVGILTGAGFYDTTFPAARDWEVALAVENVTYASHYSMTGAHEWSTWQEIVYVYLRDVLWRPVPYSA
ncbi:hypothetical protein ASPZODRAFT_142334 [Penicilliopsis zonata CBS 506.65]|uniref:Carbohydrate esterase family 1 protein n=1 Tax=Penicilliopsis zonata CBS 506.65 TaxID=1073090 RepID=A0A1L9SGZ1_9EURO|nr:hypothetical protein ASPZODRAFT_142334 [Penicilliopsis zonata CBS 506.65]OJJ46520.1 hypothetical protein ASPZODRAFT_142334 [Penicilliopsis zonata CBS 506.65]